MVPFDNLATNGQPHASAFVLVAPVQALKHIEDPIEVLWIETDAIVVLTGGSERMSAGLALLMDHKGKKLFISGVYPGLTLDRLLNNQPVPQELRACCIVLDHAAESTFGNADETRIFMEIEGYHSSVLW